MLYVAVLQAYGGRRFHFSRLPSVFWQAGCVLLGSAGVLASVAALAALLTVCLPPSCRSAVAAVTGYVQTIAGRQQPPARPIYRTSCDRISHDTIDLQRTYDTIRYDTIRDACYFNVRSKADMSQLKLLHGNNN